MKSLLLNLHMIFIIISLLNLVNLSSTKRIVMAYTIQTIEISMEKRKLCFNDIFL